MIYFSYVLGTATEREQLKILSSDEVGTRIKELKANQLGFVKVNKPENKPAYDEFVQDILQSYNSGVIIKTEPNTE